MANTDKDILITPNIGQAAYPKIDFTGFDNNTITLSVLDDGTLDFSGSAGQLFAISDSFTGTIFSVNDASGIPSIEVLDTGQVILGEFAGNVTVGSSTDNGTAKLQVTGNFTSTGEVTAYYSDERLKNLSGTIPNALEKVSKLNGYYYTENELAKGLGFHKDERQVGVSAQEVEAVIPEVVAPAPVDPNYKTVKYDRLVPLLIEAIKELQQEIEALKNSDK
jgi:hypothetical protein